MKKGLEFFQGNKNVGLVFYFTLMLLLVEQNGVFQKDGRKHNLMWLYGTNVDKIILALLKIIITFHVGFTLVDIRKPGL